MSAVEADRGWFLFAAGAAPTLLVGLDTALHLLDGQRPFRFGLAVPNVGRMDAHFRRIGFALATLAGGAHFVSGCRNHFRTSHAQGRDL